MQALPHQSRRRWSHRYQERHEREHPLKIAEPLAAAGVLAAAVEVRFLREAVPQLAVVAQSMVAGASGALVAISARAAAAAAWAVWAAVAGLAVAPA